MTTSMKQTVIKNPTWWKGRSALERGLTIIAVSGVLSGIALAVGIAVVIANSGSCDVSESSAEMLPSTAEALKGLRLRKRIQTVCKPRMAEDICYTPGCVHTASTILKNMDTDVDPCDDFYRFACGGFLKSTIIPDDKISIDTFSVIGDKVQEQLRASLEAESEPNERKPFTLAKNYYKSCMNKTAIEAKGFKPLQDILKKLGGWPVLEGDSWNDGDFDWKNLTYKIRDASFSANHFIQLGIDVNSINSTKRAIYLEPAALGLPREYLLEGFNDTIVFDYYRDMVEIAVILGADKARAKSELKESLNFEIELAKISLSNEKRPMTFVELTKNYPSVPWNEYFSRLLPSSITIKEDEVIIVNMPSYITDLKKLIYQTSKRIQANYVMWRITQDSVPYLNDYIRGRKERKSRWKECLAKVYDWLSVGSEYVRKHFNEEAKKNAVELVTDIRRQFDQILKKVDWMDEKTRERALKKAASMASHIAYPDELLDDEKLEKFYGNLQLSADNYLENAINVSHFLQEYKSSILREPVNETAWLSYATAAGIEMFYSPTENSIQSSAGILQGAVFSNDRPRYMNYGAMGFHIGRQITYGFDDEGRQYDENGNLVDWWEPPTEEKYHKRAACIVNQYGNYTAEEVHLNLNGTNALGESIADNGGIKAAYLAYNNWAARNGPEQRLPGINRTPQQMFWISAANTWCSKYRPEELKLEITTGFYIPGEFRILGPLSNMQEFATDFQCPVGSKMNPKDKCSFW